MLNSSLSRGRLRVLLALLALLGLAACQAGSSNEPLGAGAQEAGSPRDRALRQLRALHGAPVILDWNPRLDMPLYVRFGQGGLKVSQGTNQSDSPEQRALAFLDATGALFSLHAAKEQLAVRQLVHHGSGSSTVKLAQHHRGVQVEGAQLNVTLTAAGEILSIMGAIAPTIQIDVAPVLSRREAVDKVRELVEGTRPDENPQLVIVSHAVLGDNVDPSPYLAWKVYASGQERGPSYNVYIDARTGQLRDKFTTTMGLYREIWKESFFLHDPFGTQIMNEAGALPGKTPDKDALDTYDAVRVYDAYLARHGIDSFSRRGDWYKSSIHSERARANGGGVFDSGKDVTMAYAGFQTGMPALDLVSHEWTHGLLYYAGTLEGTTGQPRSVHEGLADVIACFVDSDDWKIGDKRSLQNPESVPGQHDHYSDKTSDTEAYENSTILSMTGFLIGDSACNVHPHNDPASGGSGACVQGIGREKAGRIFLRAITANLFPYMELRAARWAIIDACHQLTQETGGISERDCDSVYAAFAAVGIPGYGVPTIRSSPAAANLSADCVDQGGEGFPPQANVTLVFHDVLGAVSDRFPVRTGTDGRYLHHFGLGCTGPDAAQAIARAKLFVARTDPRGLGYRDRPMRYWAEYTDGGLIQSSVVNYALSYNGTCTPDCSGKSCGADGCGGTCGLCSGVNQCSAGTCTAPAGSPGLTVCGTISSTTRWGVDKSPILVNCDLNISGSLTIDPGVEVMFDGSDTDIFVLPGGTFNAVGSSGAPIVFTSRSSTAPGAWGGIDISGDATQARIVHAEFRYGGSRSFYAAGFPILTSGRIQPEIQNVRFVGNRRDSIGLKSGVYAGNVRLNLVGYPYMITSDVTINPGVTMTLEPGVVLKFEGNETDLFVNGRLVAQGTTSLPIYFTSAKDDDRGGDSNSDGRTPPAAGDWGGVVLKRDATLPASSIANTTMMYGGSYAYAYGQRYPLQVDGRTQPTITGLNITNNRRNAIALQTGTYTADLRLNVTGVPYLIDSDVVVNPGVTMTVDPGVIIKFESNETDLFIDGRLIAEGTAARPIYFTSVKDDSIGGDAGNDGLTPASAGDWAGIWLGKDPTLAASSIANVVITYGGSYSYAYGQRYPLQVSGRTQPTITGLSITKCRRNAIALRTGAYTADLRLNVTGVPYLIDADVTVNPGVTMTVDPGVIVKFESDETDLYINGRLIAEGTAARPIYFTSYKDDDRGNDTNGDGKSPAGIGDWGGIFLNRDTTLPNSSIANANIMFGGSYSYAYGLRYPLQVNGRTQPTITALKITKCRRNAISLLTATYTGDVRLNVLGVPYLIDSDIRVNPGSTMTVDPGVVVKLEGNETDLYIDGNFVAEGTSAQPIVFTSLRDDSVLEDSNPDDATPPDRGNWGGIVFSSTVTNARIKNARIAFGGSSSFYAADCSLNISGAAPLIESVDFDRNEDAVCAFANAQPDLGDGALGSKGNNRFLGHVPGDKSWAVYNASAREIYARNNFWGTTSAADIAATVRDRTEDPAVGEVYYEGFLSH